MKKLLTALFTITFLLAVEILTHVQHAVVNQTKPKKNVHQLTHQKSCESKCSKSKNVLLRKILKDGILTKQIAMEQINLVQNLKLKNVVQKKNLKKKIMKKKNHLTMIIKNQMIQKNLRH